jgi:protein required for attachment to host cells
MTKSITWIAVLDHQRLRVYRTEPPRWTLSQEQDTARDRQLPRSSEIGSDREGRSFDSLGGQRHAMQPHSDPREIEARRFVASIAADLLQARRDDRYQRLVIVAPPKAMGELRGLLPAAVAEVVAAELTEDLTRMPLKELESLLARREILPLRG